MKQPVWAQSSMDNIFHLGVDAELGAAPKVKLFSDSVPLNPNTDITTLTESTFGGYGAVSFAGTATIRDLEGNPGRMAGPALFLGNGGGSPQNVYGVFVENDDGNRMFAYNLEAPVPMGATGSWLEVNAPFFNPDDLVRQSAASGQ